MRVLGLDAGKTNFGAAVIELHPTKYKIHGTKMLDNRITDAKTAQEESILYMEEIKQLKKEHKFEAIVVERYQTRGIKGTTIEFVSMMIGILLVTFPDTPVKLVTAATWKNRYNANGLDLKELYADLKENNKPIKPAFRKTEHELDACLMGFYGAALLQDLPYFAFVRSMKQEKKMLENFLVSSDI